jgi:hypothetical protein
MFWYSNLHEETNTMFVWMKTCNWFNIFVCRLTLAHSVLLSLAILHSLSFSTSFIPSCRRPSTFQIWGYKVYPTSKFPHVCSWYRWERPCKKSRNLWRAVSQTSVALNFPIRAQSNDQGKEGNTISKYWEQQSAPHSPKKKSFFFCGLTDHM